MKIDSPCSSYLPRRLKGLANVHRWSVIDILMDRSKTVGELLAQLGLEASLLSRHLKILRREGIVESVRKGKRVGYGLSEGVAMVRSGTEN